MAILDLTVYANDTLDITMPDGEVVSVKKPTQGFYLELLNHANSQERDVEKLPKIVLSILNYNTSNRTFTLEDIVEKLTFVMMRGIYNTYVKWMNELTANPC